MGVTFATFRGTFLPHAPIFGAAIILTPYLQRQFTAGSFLYLNFFKTEIHR
jgi:hypothetical protein